MTLRACATCQRLIRISGAVHGACPFCASPAEHPRGLRSALGAAALAVVMTAACKQAAPADIGSVASDTTAPNATGAALDTALATAQQRHKVGAIGGYGGPPLPAHLAAISVEITATSTDADVQRVFAVQRARLLNCARAAASQPSSADVGSITGTLTISTIDDSAVAIGSSDGMNEAEAACMKRVLARATFARTSAADVPFAIKRLRPHQ
jgi:hypothetical protein